MQNANQVSRERRGSLLSLLGQDSSNSVMRRSREALGAWVQSRAKRRMIESFGDMPAPKLCLADWTKDSGTITAFYGKCFNQFHTSSPQWLRDHREYFSLAGRGFGEDAFHVMWFLLFQELAPESFLEIGVFRGQTLSLAALLGRHFGYECLVQGISPFSPAGDGVSSYPQHVDYLQDTLDNFAHFALSPPSLLKAFSTDPEAITLISSRKWGCIYIDGNHDYEVARRDWEICSSHVSSGGIVVLDDAGLGTEYRPPVFATAGHPGPSRLATEIDRSRFREILQVGHNRVFQKLGDKG